MDDDRKKVIDEYAMPTTMKAANLHKMTHKNFNRDRKTWKEDYARDFKKMKLALSISIANHFSDYDLDWTVRVDASNVAVGAVL